MPENETPKPRRVVRLDDLTPEQRRIVLALLDAQRAAEARRKPEQSERR